MSNERIITDRRLIAALDYIDQKYIDDVFSIIKEPDIAVEYVPGNKTPFKYWKQFTALAACMVLLAFSAPIFSYFSKVIGNWGAAAGSGTTEEISDILDSESKELYELFPDYTPTPLSEERIAELAEVIPVLATEDEWTRFVWSVQRYLGDFNGCYCYYSVGQLTHVETKTIAGYDFTYPMSFTLDAIYNGEKMYLSEAYDRGYLTKDEVGMMAAYHARVMKDMVTFDPPETTTPLYNLFPDYVPDPLDEVKKKEIEVLLGGKTNWYHETRNYRGIWYLGTFNGYVIFVHFDEYKDLDDRVVIAEYPFTLAKDAKLVAYVEGELIDLEVAYEKGLFTDEEIGMVASLNKKLIWAREPEGYFKDK